LKKLKKIDFHVHVTPPEIIKNVEKFAKKEPYFALLASSKKNKFAQAGEVVAELDNSGFDEAVVFGFGFTDMGLCRMVNDYVIESIKQFPNRLNGFCVVPGTDKKAAQEIERCVNLGLKGVGELFPTGQNMQIGDKSKTDPWSVYCAERHLPVLIHTNEPTGHYYPGKTNTSLHEIELFAEHNPDLKIIFAHWGGGFFFYQLMSEIDKLCKNIYYDCAASPLLFDKRIYKIACDLGLQNKLVFGSDFPLLPISRYLSEIESSGISSDDKALLLGSNAEKLLLP
jgi:predicted TIM-barrel fold metal-dependent hydrolase